MLFVIVIALLNLVQVPVSEGQMHLISTYQISSLTNEKCVISMNSKHIDHILTSMIAYFETYKELLDGSFQLGEKVEIMKYDPSIFDTTSAFRGKTPILIKKSYLDSQNLCYGMNGKLPEPVTDAEIALLADLLSAYNLQYTLVDVELEDLSLVYPSGTIMSSSLPIRFKRESSALPSLELTLASTSTTTTVSSVTQTSSAKFSVSDYQVKILSALHGFNPNTNGIVVLDKTKANEIGKVVCLIDRIFYLLGSNTNLTVQALKTNLVNEFEVLISNYQLFRETISASILNTNVEWAGALANTYSVPEFVTMSQELLTMTPHDFSTVGQNNFLNEVLLMTKLISEKLGNANALISKGFITFPQGTCAIANGLQLECLCPNPNVKWSRNNIIPTEKNGKLLAFDNFAFATESKVEDGFCFTIKPQNNLLLSDECCTALRKLQDNAISVCPVIYTANWSPISQIEELNIIDNTYTGIKTTCGESVDSELKNDDIYRLSLCEQSISNSMGKYTLPNLGKFLKDHLIKATAPWFDVSKFSQREILIMGITGGALTFFLFLFICIFCIISPKFRKFFVELCKKCGECCKKDMEPLGANAPSYEMSTKNRAETSPLMITSNA